MARFLSRGIIFSKSRRRPWRVQTRGYCYCGKIKKQSRYTPWWRFGERRYSSYSFLTSALDGGEWSVSRPGRALPRGKDPPVPIVQEAGWASAGLDTVVRGKILCLCQGSNRDRPVAQSVVRHCTDWAWEDNPSIFLLRKGFWLCGCLRVEPGGTGLLWLKASTT
jgi:hypothetical protein